MNPIGEELIDEIIKQDMVRPDAQCPNLLVWSANAAEQLEAVVARETEAIYKKWAADKDLLLGAIHLLTELGHPPGSEALISAAQRYRAAK